MNAGVNVCESVTVGVLLSSILVVTGDTVPPGPVKVRRQGVGEGRRSLNDPGEGTVL